jgi:hypothetical protein
LGGGKKVALLTKSESRKRWSEIRDLLNEWDPIGVMGLSDWPRDEYECLAGPLLRLLEGGARQGDVADYLRNEIEEHFGLDPSHYDFQAVAARLQAWFSERWAGSHV